MKKILFILICMLTITAAKAQISGSYDAFTQDTITNAETIYLVLDSPRPIKNDALIVLTVVPENVSGTATVTATPQGSLDNVNYFDLQTSADTINDAGTVALKSYGYTNALYRYYRLKIASTGTGVTKLNGQLGLKN